MPKRAPSMTGWSARPRPAPTASRPSKPKSRNGRQRAARADEQIEQLTDRAEETRAAIVELSSLPQLLADRRLKLMNTLGEAEAERKAASDALQTAENEVRQADQDLRAVQELAVHMRARNMRGWAPGSRPARSGSRPASGASPKRCNASRTR